MCEILNLEKNVRNKLLKDISRCFRSYILLMMIKLISCFFTKLIKADSKPEDHRILKDNMSVWREHLACFQ